MCIDDKTPVGYQVILTVYGFIIFDIEYKFGGFMFPNFKYTFISLYSPIKRIKFKCICYMITCWEVFYELRLNKLAVILTNEIIYHQRN